MPQIVKLRPGRNCVVGHDDIIVTPCGCKYSIDFDAVKGQGRRFQLKSVDDAPETLHNTDIGESRSPALAGK